MTPRSHLSHPQRIRPAPVFSSCAPVDWNRRCRSGRRDQGLGIRFTRRLQGAVHGWAVAVGRRHDQRRHCEEQSHGVHEGACEPCLTPSNNVWQSYSGLRLSRTKLPAKLPAGSCVCPRIFDRPCSPEMQRSVRGGRCAAGLPRPAYVWLQRTRCGTDERIWCATIASQCLFWGGTSKPEMFRQPRLLLQWWQHLWQYRTC